MSVNKVILVGNLGKDPELRYTPSGTAVCTFSLATTDRFKNKQGEQQERTEWHRVAMFGRLAEIAAEYLRKGSQVYVEGSLRTRKWQDKDGNDRWTTEVVARDVQFLTPKGGSESSGSYYSDDPGPAAAGPPTGGGYDHSSGTGSDVPF